MKHNALAGSFFERNLKYIFPLPAAVFIILLMAFPIVYTLFVSFSDWALTSGRPLTLAGFKSYIDVIKDSRFLNAVLRTFAFTFGVVAAETVLGTIIALVLNNDFRGKGLLKFLLLLPLVVTPVAIGIVFNLFYDPTIGFLNYILSVLHLPQSGWVTETSTVMQALMLVDIWQWTPMIALIMLAGLSGLPHEVFESARVDGAGGVQTFFHITLPMIMPTMLTALVLRAVDALKTYDIIYAMTRGGPGYSSETLNIYAFKLSFEYFEMGRSSVSLVFLFLIVLFFSLGVMKLRTRFEV
ncbi:MAG: sugar ABC transporter permease [Spirochaetaceae bacterium]|jgi:multiple sugar transport system permease protein|nr:sugar ABC transporter permease [Spirochaetaceae bacterium]